MMDGSSLRMMVGMYSALGTLEEMSWRQRGELLRAQLPGSPGSWEGPKVAPHPPRGCWEALWLYHMQVEPIGLLEEKRNSPGSPMPQHPVAVVPGYWWPVLVSHLPWVLAGLKDPPGAFSVGSVHPVSAGCSWGYCAALQSW